MKLFTVGESISQGFMSGATAKTELSFSSIIAGKMGINKKDYRYPNWAKGGLPINLEDIFRLLYKKLGTDIKGPFEWTRALFLINRYLDETEDYYERGKGALHMPTPDHAPYYHNVSVRGFDISDAWTLNTSIASKIIEAKGNKDNLLFGTTSESMLRTAVKILNPSLDKKYDDFTQLDWLKAHSEKEGIQYTILWLGANNVLSTVLSLKIRPTPGDGSPVNMSFEERRAKGWNLWHPADFEAEYHELIKRVVEIMQDNKEEDWHIFLGNVPLVTIIPLIKGVGETTRFPELGVYFKYYTYFPFDEQFAHSTGLHLNIQQALYIDRCILAYNAIIKKLVDAENLQIGVERLHVVDIAQALRDMAWKRNDAKPVYQFPAYFDYVYPMVDTKFYHVDAAGDLKQGGIFSLDGVHPSSIGQGLVAWEFLKVMRKVDNSIPDLDNDDWQAIFAADQLYSNPIPLMQEVYQHNALAEYIYKTMQFFRD